MPFTVIGVLERKGQNTWGRDQDDVIIMPYTTCMKKLTGTTRISMILASATSMKALPRATEEITQLLRARHRIPAGGEDDFTVRTQQDIADIVGSTANVMRILLAAIASVSLLVGGIGIMNIMLVSVTERTREIGIRMAVGAKGWHVLMQFLSEAVVLACFGGILGIALGFTVARPGGALRPLADPDLPRGDPARVLLRRRDRGLLRVLAGAQGLASGSHRGAALRVIAAGG